MLRDFSSVTHEIPKTGYVLHPDMEICQTDYPLDWYQKEIVPYAQEYQSLPDRKPQTVLRWMRRYMEPALAHFGDSLLLLAHYYMGGEIVKLVEIFGGKVADSYQLALMAYDHPEKKIIVESAVHFMAESIAILAHADQQVWITNPKAGCTMEMNAKDFMVMPAIDELNERYGKDGVLPVCYMNTSGRIKALTGEQGGAVCTSSNVQKIFQWALAKNKKVLFIPDQHMGENVAGWLGVPPEQLALWPGGVEGSRFSLHEQPPKVLQQFDAARIILFGSACGVHTYYTPEMVLYWQGLGFHVAVHPECRKGVVDVSDSTGSTAFLWDQVISDRAKTKRYAIGTENHMVQNLKVAAKEKGIEVVNLGEAKLKGSPPMGCGCATMSRNDPPHLVGVLDLLRKGACPDLNEVKAGDVIQEFTGKRQRLSDQGQQWVRENAKRALENMIAITRGG